MLCSPSGFPRLLLCILYWPVKPVLCSSCVFCDWPRLSESLKASCVRLNCMEHEFKARPRRCNELWIAFTFRLWYSSKWRQRHWSIRPGHKATWQKSSLAEMKRFRQFYQKVFKDSGLFEENLSCLPQEVMEFATFLVAKCDCLDFVNELLPSIPCVTLSVSNTTVVWLHLSLKQKGKFAKTTKWIKTLSRLTEQPGREIL